MADELGKVANDKFDEKFLRPDKAIYARKLDPSMFDSKKKFRAEEKKKVRNYSSRKQYHAFFFFFKPNIKLPNKTRHEVALQLIRFI